MGNVTIEQEREALRQALEARKAMRRAKRKLTPASKAKIVREFGLKAKVEALLVSLGATLRSESSQGFYRSREWTLSTKVGLLGVSPYEDWIACVFEAPNYLTNQTAKWNHHSFASTGTFTDRDLVRGALQSCLDGFAAEIAKLRGIT